jgi:hypothetical protein
VTKEVVALKFISKSALGDLKDADLVFTEVHCVQSLSHENVIKVGGGRGGAAAAAAAPRCSCVCAECGTVYAPHGAPSSSAR